MVYSKQLVYLFLLHICNGLFMHDGNATSFMKLTLYIIRILRCNAPTFGYN